MPSTEQLTKLRTLANFLDDLPHDKFHMPRWCSEDATKDSCGTAGCAAGWAATVFKKEGWRITLEDGGLVWWDGRPGTGAFARFFGINYMEAYDITSDFESYGEEFDTDVEGDDITPWMAAERIRRVIKKYDPSVLEEQTVVEETINA